MLCRLMLLWFLLAFLRPARAGDLATGEIGLPLRDLADALQAPIVVHNRLAGMTIRGAWRYRDVADLLDQLAWAYDLRIEPAGDTWRISPPEETTLLVPAGSLRPEEISAFSTATLVGDRILLRGAPAVVAKSAQHLAELATRPGVRLHVAIALSRRTDSESVGLRIRGLVNGALTAHADMPGDAVTWALTGGAQVPLEGKADAGAGSYALLANTALWLLSGQPASIESGQRIVRPRATFGEAGGGQTVTTGYEYENTGLQIRLTARHYGDGWHCELQVDDTTATGESARDLLKYVGTARLAPGLPVTLATIERTLSSENTSGLPLGPLRRLMREKGGSEMVLQVIATLLPEGAPLPPIVPRAER